MTDMMMTDMMMTDMMMTYIMILNIIRLNKDDFLLWFCPSVDVLAVGFWILKCVLWEIKILKNAKILNTFRP